MVSIARLLLGVFALLSVYVDPAQPTRYPDLAYSLLAAYCAFALLVAAVSLRSPPSRPTALATHCVDVLFFSLLVYLTDGPTSPFFVYFTFTLLSATLRWSWRGALATTAATVLVFTLVAVLGDEALAEHIPRLLLRIAYLIAAGILFAYFGAAVERSRRRLARLATWPAAASSASRDPALESTLAHAASTMDIPRLLVVWEYALEPHVHTAEFRNGATQFETAPGIVSGFLEAPDRPKLLTPRTSMPRRLRDWLDRRGIRSAVMAPISGSTLHGVVFFVTHGRSGKDLLPLANIAAMRIAAEIEQHNLRVRLIEAAASEERARLARDIHDDLLQALTAVSLQLKSLEKQVTEGAAKSLTSVRLILADQQGRLRRLVDDTRDQRRAARSFAVADEIKSLLRTAEKQWGCGTKFTLNPPDLKVDERDGKALSMLLAEAIANGVRHGKASAFNVAIRAEGRKLTLTIDDNGEGLPALAGTYGHEQVVAAGLGSRSLRDRIRDLGWRMYLTSSPEGMAIRIEAPTEQS